MAIQFLDGVNGWMKLCYSTLQQFCKILFNQIFAKVYKHQITMKMIHSTGYEHCRVNNYIRNRFGILIWKLSKTYKVCHDKSNRPVKCPIGNMLIIISIYWNKQYLNTSLSLCLTKHFSSYLELIGITLVYFWQFISTSSWLSWYPAVKLHL